MSAHIYVHVKDGEDLLGALRTQNFNDVDPKEGFPKVAFYKKTKGGSCTTVVLACSAKWRDRLMSRERLYIDCERYLMRDFLDITCCAKCQWYGHSMKHCKAEKDSCSKCGDVGHGHKECISKMERCATCVKAGKAADDHETAAPTCPARIAAQ
ncbi:unnamed protein product [Leptidea sinapis]|uniref:CCHC-type domain-containing protein n=1 Tax=Leptidea sinapis TaxID=189913 RepID=A0A5E4PZE8_9NEOP|nr:unnamed protein product [Leptidea sinapis]